ncbi:hypothetical protein CLV51_101365 [Chitinophaga niastensis]|uniref:Uncharacterized protein n=1 Tax=Chitinophaga niastensis TaxID=536980 RepID=A0A2P8HS62_CHINA|nr:hypothetical protein [Chitinophaga niastensis]PSL49035.1 hypothetical protein CLV51_101365 [Chitinophaga niastensis]
MNKKPIKYYSALFGKEVIVTINDSLAKPEGKVLAPNKLAAANKRLSKLKELPKQ